MRFHRSRGPAVECRPARNKTRSLEENHKKRLFALLLLAMFSTSALTACNTMAGAGKDVQKVGEKVEEKAQDCKDAKC